MYDIVHKRVFFISRVRQSGYTIIYVVDVLASVEFFGRAFGLTTRFVYEADYGELETGQTALIFAAHHLGRNNFPAGYVAADSSSLVHKAAYGRAG